MLQRSWSSFSSNKLECQGRTLFIIPFFFYRDISIARTDIKDNNANAAMENKYTSTHIKILQEIEPHITIFQLNKQSIPSASD